MPRPGPCNCCEGGGIGPPACRIRLTVSIHCDGAPKVGVTVDLTGPVVTSGVTNGLGMVTFVLDDNPGTYTATATYSTAVGNVTRSWTEALECGDDVAVGLSCRRVCVVGCGSLPVPGATLQVKSSGGTVLDTQTTGADGCYHWGSWPVGGTQVTATPPAGLNLNPQTSSLTGPFGGTQYDITVLLPAASGYKCCADGCGPEAIYNCDSVTLTGPGGTVTLNRSGGASSCTYIGYEDYEIDDPAEFVDVCDGANHTGPVPVTIRYTWSLSTGLLSVAFPAADVALASQNNAGNLCYHLITLAANTGTAIYGVGSTPCPPGSPGGAGPIEVWGLFYVGGPGSIWSQIAQEDAPGCAGRLGGAWSYSGSLGERDYCQNASGDSVAGGDTQDHPLASLTGWGASPAWSVTYTCGGAPLMAMAPPGVDAGGGAGGTATTTAAGSPSTRKAGPSLADLQSNARSCPHNEVIPRDERAGCGCLYRCTAGKGNHPQGGTDVRNCWACPIAPRRGWEAEGSVEGE